MKRQGVLTNFMDLGLSTVVGSLLALWATSHLARQLGVETFGVFSFARAIGEYLEIFATLGLTVAGTRAIASDPERRDSVVAYVLLLRTILALVGAAVLFLIGQFSGDQELHRLLILFAVLGIVTATTIDWVFTAMENLRFLSIVRVLGRLAYAVIVVVMVQSSDDVVIAAAALVAEAVIVQVSLFVRYRSPIHMLPALRNPRGSLDLIREAIPLGIAQLSRQLKTNLDLVLLAVMSTSLIVGYYSAAYRLVLFVNAFAAMYATVLMPRVARSSSEDGAEYRSVVAASFRATAVVGVGIGAIGIALAGPLVVAFFGEEYLPSAGVLPWLMVAAAFLFVSASLGSSAIAIGRANLYVVLGLSAAALNLVGNLILIPLFNMYGAAIMTAITEAALAVALAIGMWHNGVSEAVRPGWLARLLLAGAVEIVLVLLLLEVGVPVWAVAIVAVVAFLPIMLLLGATTVEELRYVVSVLDSSAESEPDVVQ